MLKKEITYENFDEEEVTETFYFNISKSELVDMETEVEMGFTKWIQNIIDAKDQNKLIQEFKKLVLRAYGEKSEDGKRFIKSEELRQDFAQTAAYDKLFIELATDDKAAAAFMIGILPKDMRGDVEKEMAKDKPAATLPPPPSA